MASVGLLGARPTPSPLTHFPYVVGAFPAAAMGFVYFLSPCRPFKWQKSSRLFCHPNPHWFLKSEVMAVYLPIAGNLGCVVWPGAGMAHSQGIPPNFYQPHVNVGPSILLSLHVTLCPLHPGSMTPPLLPIWMNVTSLNHWLSDFHTAQFSDGSSCYFFF